MARERTPSLDDRQLDALLAHLDAIREELHTLNRRLAHLDAIREELHTLNRRLDTQETLLRIAGELTSLNESLQALAYAALGRQPPQVRRRRTG